MFFPCADHFFIFTEHPFSGAGRIDQYLIKIFWKESGQLSRFLTKFNDGRRDLEANILSIAAQLKSIQTSLTEMVAEQKRVSRLTIEQLELQKAEMTGDFDIVEEPIPTLPESKLGGPSAGVKFPELKL